jgi:hypothetical protein
MTRRVFTVEDSNQTLPLVRRVVEDIVRDYSDLAEMAKDYKSLRGRKDRDEGHEERLNYLKQEMANRSRAIDECVSELAEIGCEMKDLESGLVDFPAEMDDRRILLCWRLGEDRVDHWHETHEGFPGRKPLPVTVPED